MIAIDTNVLVRLILNEDAEQTKRARAVVEGVASVLVPYSVLLEAAWVLGVAYKVPKAEVLSSLAAVLGLPNVIAQAPDQVRRAFAWASQGVALGDALHLAGSEGCETFVSFDRRFARQAAGLGAAPEVVSP